MKKNNYIGDGLAFFNACANKKKIDIQEAMGIKSTATFYGLYMKVQFDEHEKKAAAKALGKSVEEIFNSQNVNNEYGKGVPSNPVKPGSTMNENRSVELLKAKAEADRAAADLLHAKNYAELISRLPTPEGHPKEPATK